jgi:hypothetical protein
MNGPLQIVWEREEGDVTLVAEHLGFLGSVWKLSLTFIPKDSNSEPYVCLLNDVNAVRLIARSIIAQDLIRKEGI